MQVFGEMDLEDVSDADEESRPEQLAEVIASKHESCLPLYVVAAAAQLVQFEKTQFRHRQVDSYGQVPRAKAVGEYAHQLPGAMTPLWTDYMLPKIEALVDYLTVQWTMIHLLNHPEGISRQNLQTMVRATLDRVMQREDVGAKGVVKRGVQRVLVVGSLLSPDYLLDIDTQMVLWDHRLHNVKAALPLIRSCYTSSNDDTSPTP